MNDKEQARTDAIVEVLHHGAGLNDSSIKGTFRIIGQKLTGDIPLGAESPTFATRKRMILFSLQFSRIRNFLQFFLTLLMLFIVILMVWATYPSVIWWLFLMSAVLAYWAYSSISNFVRKGRLISVIKAQQQLYPDPVIKTQTQRVYDVQRHAKQFAQSRLASRFIALFIMLMSAYTMNLYTADMPTQLKHFCFLAPFTFMLAVGIMFYPISKAENLHLYGVTQIPFKYMPFGMKLCLFIGALLSATMFIVDTFGINIFS